MKRPIITLENGIEVLETTGDADAFEHGGGVLFREPRRRDIFWTFWSARELGEKNYQVFTAPILQNVIDYFRPDIKELVKVSGVDARDLVRLGRSANPSDRLKVVMIICDCCGPSRIDPNHEPEIMSIYELSERWGDVFGYDIKNISKIEFEDFIIREVESDYECGTIDGKYLGRHKEYKHALCAIADFMNQFGRERSNVFHEYDHDHLELVSWNPETFVGKIPKRRGKLPEARWRNSMKKYLINEIHRKTHRKPEDISQKRRQAKIRTNQKNRVRKAIELRQSFESIYGKE